MINRNKNHSWSLFFAVILTIGIIFLKELFYPQITNTVIILLISVFFLTLKFNEFYSFLFFILPLSCGIPGYIILICFIILLFRSKTFSSWQFIPPIIILIIEFFHYFLYQFESSIIPVLSFSSFILIFFFTAYNNDQRINLSNCLQLFCVGLLVSSIIVCIKLIVYYDIESFFAGELRSGLVNTIENDNSVGSFSLNANSMGFYSITVFSILLVSKINLSSKFHIILMCLSIMIGIISFSRTWILCALLAILLLSLSRKSLSKLFSLSIIILIILLVLPDSILNNIFDKFYSRFSENNIDTAGGRTEIFNQYITYITADIHRIIFGIGATYYKTVTGFYYSVHSGILQIIVGSGLLGLFVFIISFIKFFMKYRSHIINFIPFIICFIFNQSIQFYNPYYLIIPFIGTLYLLKYENNRSNS